MLLPSQVLGGKPSNNSLGFQASLRYTLDAYFSLKILNIILRMFALLDCVLCKNNFIADHAKENVLIYPSPAYNIYEKSKLKLKMSFSQTNKCWRKLYFFYVKEISPGRMHGPSYIYITLQYVNRDCFKLGDRGHTVATFWPHIEPI